MKPHRVRMTHTLVVNYGLYRLMEVFRPKVASLWFIYHCPYYCCLFHVNVYICIHPPYPSRSPLPIWRNSTVMTTLTFWGSLHRITCMRWVWQTHITTLLLFCSIIRVSHVILPVVCPMCFSSSKVSEATSTLQRGRRLPSVWWALWILSTIYIRKYWRGSTPKSRPKWHCHKLGRRAPPCKKKWSKWVLLRKWLRSSHTWAP